MIWKRPMKSGQRPLEIVERLKGFNRKSERFHLRSTRSSESAFSVKQDHFKSANKFSWSGDFEFHCLGNWFVSIWNRNIQFLQLSTFIEVDSDFSVRYDFFSLKFARYPQTIFPKSRRLSLEESFKLLETLEFILKNEHHTDVSERLNEI